MAEQHSFNNDVANKLGNIEGKLSLILDNQKEFHEKYEKLEAKVEQKFDAVDTRVGRVENKLHWYSGGLATAVGIFTMFGDSIRALFRGV